MKDKNEQLPQTQSKASNNKIPYSDLAIGGARGGPMDKLLMLREGKTLKQWVDGLHRWVK